MTESHLYFIKKKKTFLKIFFKCLSVDLPQNLIISEVHVDTCISVKSRFHEELGLSLFMFS